MNNYGKYIFFDVDGVLSAPCYYNKNTGEYGIGFDDQGWRDYLEEYKQDAYKDCKAVGAIYDFINGLNSDVTKYVLSSVENENEANAKIKFLDNKYPNMFEAYYFVKSDDEKIKHIIEFAHDNNIDIDECTLVDDTYLLLLKAHNNGIRAIHISNILAYNITK